jgi:N-acetylglucosamine-6-phosphate deacetylase
LHEAQRDTPRPEQNDALAALVPNLEAQHLVIADAPNEWFALRADRFAREFGLKLALVGSGREYRRLDEIVATGRPLIVPLNFPAPPSVVMPEAAAQISLTSLMHWDIAPENPARLAQAGVTMAFTTRGLKETKDFLPKLREAVERGLARDAALAALTTTPSQLCGLSERLGTIETGKLAHLVVARGDLFAENTKLEQVWIDGRVHMITPEPDYDLRGKWELTTKNPAGEKLTLTLALKGAGKLSGTLTPPKAKKAKTEPEAIELDHVGQSRAHLSAAFDAEPLADTGIARLTAIATLASEGSATLRGHIVWANGTRTELTAHRTEVPEEDSAEDEESKASGDGDEKDVAKKDDQKDTEDEKPKVDRAASFSLNYPLGAYGLASPVEQPAAVLFTHATIWTCTDEGVLEDASLLVEHGKIVAVGKDIAAPRGAIVIDCKGQHLAPGIVDCHSHMATDGGINETGQAITAEVRIGDFIDPDDINIYRQLAGGVTTVNILHGSANPIGGQNQVCKLRWGQIDEAMKFAGAPPGIKFALGENVKQSNWGDRFTTRYPQTRMGVEQLMRDEFAAARQYTAEWERWQQHKTGLPPRKDLQLEAVSEVLQGKRWIHCHSYRQDEILALLKLTDEYNIRIGTLQHILEGYKVADEMARRGVMGSSFSDWWSYKFEVYDAIPYNGAVMHKAGVVVSFNSDDLELARHLNHEAAKAMKYGGVEPVEALKFVTLNPAKQLRIEDRVGSLAPGKDADLVVWSGAPLALTSRCEQTWIDGRRYFDRAADKKQREVARAQHAALVQKILLSGDAMLSPEELDGQDADLWPRADLFCGHHHGHDHGHGHHHE